jgi:lysophospholipase L1-like esterase
VWIAGDSTVANGNTPCPRGWGAEIGAFFNEEVTVLNRAIGGRSVWTWLYDVQDSMSANGVDCQRTLDQQQNPVLQQHWSEMLDGMKEGDFLLIQFGINDGSSTCPRHVSGPAFEEAYAMMARAAQERGAQPVFLTPVSMISCNGSTAVGSRGFLTETANAGAAEGVPIIDLHSLSVELYNELGFCPLPSGHSDISASTPGEVGAFFCDDHTHFDQPGAKRIAQVIVDALVEQGITLGSYVQTP